MRFSLNQFRVIVFVFGLGSVAYAQDPTQIAVQASQQANAQAMQASQQANTDAMNAAQQASAGSIATILLPTPKVSLKPGNYTTPQTVRLTDRGRGATIYYTTDGWTPTALSRVYDGPITLSATSHLQAIAIGRGCESLVLNAVYTFPAVQSQDPLPIVSRDGVLRTGMELPLAFASGVDSSTAQVGDRVPLRLTLPMELGGRTYQPSEVLGQATVVHVDHTGAGGAPGVLTIRVDSLTVSGKVVPMATTVTLEGKNRLHRALSTVWIPVVGAGLLLEHGDNADIAVGTPIMARVAADTAVLPAS